MSEHTVEKIGGTSMSNFGLMLDNIFLGNRRIPDEIYQRIFVVSAYGGITDLLLENKKTGAPGIYAHFAADNNEWDPTLNALLTKMCAINAGFADLGLDVARADAFVRERIEGVRACLRDLRRLCSYGHFHLPDYLPVVRELLSSVGEAHSAYNSTLILQARGVQAVLVDLTGWMEDDNLPFEEKIKWAFRDIDLKKSLPIVTGYTKCAEGLMGSYDRGYSEITFSKIATVTRAREAIIHKEFHLSSSDPKLVGLERVKIIGNTNYDVADQLADLGLEAIHPRASKGLENLNIPLRVKNAFEPEHPGTLISKDYRSDKPRVEIVTGRRDLLAVEVWDPDMVGQAGYDFELLRFLAKYQISYVAKNTNANTITHYVVRGKAGLEACIDEIRQTRPSAKIRTRNVAIVSAIGNNMNVPGFLSKAADALAGEKINILAIDQCMRQVNMQFIVKEADFDRAIIALHRGLIEN